MEGSITRCETRITTMTKWPNDTSKVDKLRRAGLYFGPVVLGAIAGNFVYGSACGGRSVVVGTSTPPLLNAVLLVGGAVLAWKVAEPIGRLSFATFVLYQIAVLFQTVAGVVLNEYALTVLLVVFALLLTRSAARRRSNGSRLLGGVTFAGAFVFSLGARHYSDVLIGLDTVVSSNPIC
jgi:hypothetical protein